MNYLDIKQKLDGYKPYILGAKDVLVSAVMVPLVEVNGELSILLEVRSARLKSQPCDVSFPGGKIDQEDVSPLFAAKREVCEELGISEDDLDVITELDLLVAPYGVIIHNFLGKINDISKIKPSPEEVHEIFTVPISFFKENEPLLWKSKMVFEREEDFPYELIPFGKNYPFKEGMNKTLFWQYDGHTIWGMTAAIIQNLLELLK